MASYDIIIKGGLVASSERVEALDIGITDGKVAARAASLEGADAGRTIDASGRFVLPGALDPHFHPQYGDNIEVGSVAAAHGGITTLVSFVYGGKHIPGGYEGQDLNEAFDEFTAGDGSRSTLDWGAHMGVLDPTTIEQIPSLAGRGVNSFKFFLAYKRRGMMVDDQEFLHAMRLIADEGAIAMVHAENGYAIDYLEQKFIAAGTTSLEYFEPSRPKNVEYEAVNRAIELAKLVDCPLYLVHMTTGESVAMIRSAREAGQHVIGETCPQYLLQTNEDLLAYGKLAICTPPYRTAWDNETLWQGLADGDLSTVGSDHSPHPRERKHYDNIFKIPVGTPQVETLLPLMYGRGVSEGRLTLQRLVAVMCENPARVFGIFPQKGSLQVGADADVAIIDPRRETTFDEKRFHSVVDYNTYHGWTVLGTPVHTMQRGNDVLVDGELKAAKGGGRFVSAGPLAADGVSMEPMFDAPLKELLGEGIRLVDLSQPWSADTPTFPTDEAPIIRWAKRLASHGTKHQEITCTLHIGTHLDAPLHWRDGGMDVASIPLERLVGPAVVVDLRDVVSDYSLILPEHIEERADVRDGDIVVLYTGYDRYYLGGEEPDEVAYFFKHPGGYRELAQWCERRKLRWLGMDMSSPDHPMNSNLRGKWPHLAEEAEVALGQELSALFPPSDFQVMHTHLFAHDIPIVENIGGPGVRSLLGQRTTLCAFPWRFERGEAAMVRVVALVPE